MPFGKKTIGGSGLQMNSILPSETLGNSYQLHVLTGTILVKAIDRTKEIAYHCLNVNVLIGRINAHMIPECDG